MATRILLFFTFILIVLTVGCSQYPQQSQNVPQTQQGVLPPSQAPPQGESPNQGNPSNQTIPGMMNGAGVYGNQVPAKKQFNNNGERIYFTGQDDSGTYIQASSINMPMSSMAGGCYMCHGAYGKGGKIPFMMGTIDVPDIRFKTLSVKDPNSRDPAYTEETLKRAITQGLDSSGNPLNQPMPRWQMNTKDLNDIISYLKSLP